MLARRAVRARDDEIRRRLRIVGRRVAEQLARLHAPVVLEPARQAQDDDVEEAPDEKAEQPGQRGQLSGFSCPCKIGHALCGDQPTTAASLKIGRYMPMTMPPTSTPMMTMMNGSRRLDSASTALLTSCS